MAGKFLSSVGRVFGIGSGHDANDSDKNMSDTDRAGMETASPQEEVVLSPKLQLRQEDFRIFVRIWLNMRIR